MCGIAGVISGTDGRLLETAVKMAAIASHRGPDGSSTCIASSTGWQLGGANDLTWCALAHNRLAIIDLAPASDQPIISKDGKFSLVYNGEIYNYQELRTELEISGVVFTSRGDAEVLLEALIKWGEMALPRLRGMFAFTFVDLVTRDVLIARDSLGIKPIYYMTCGEQFYFCSEIKQLTEIPEWKARPNLESLASFLFWGTSDIGDQTSFSGVNSLPGGHLIKLNGLQPTRHEIHKWASFENYKFKGTYEEATSAFSKIFSETIGFHLRSDVPIGSCLSGGLDSSAIVSSAHHWYGREILNHVTVTASSEDSRIDETKYAKMVSDQVNATAVIVHPERTELWTLLPTIAWHQDEPIASSSIYAQWKVFEAARNSEIKVMLDGQGGDEVLAGYDSFVNIRLLELLTHVHLGGFWSEYKNFSREHRTSFQGFTGIIVSLSGSRRLMTAVGKLMGKSELNPKHSLGPKMRKSLPSRSPFQPIGKINKNVGDLSVDMLTRTSLPKLLRYEDRSSMAHGIEARVPFCDVELVNFLLSLPSEYLIGTNGTKRILRSGLEGIIPQGILNRQDKVGFETAQSQWLKDSIPEVSQALRGLNQRLPGFIPEWSLDVDKLAKAVHTNDSALIWRMVSVAAWAEAFDVGE
jgi:asparagine synthase (glutamine-hydrolysing)